jgi:hypothetical protein
MAEKLWPVGEEGVVREIIPGGHEERHYLLYPNEVSVRFAQKLERSRFVPKFLAALMDDGMPVDGGRYLDEYPTDEYEVPAIAISEETLMQNTIAGWRNTVEETRRAA